MKKILVLAVICLITTGVFAQKAIHAEAIKGPDGTPELTATGAFAFQAGELADTVKKTDEQVILVFNKYRMTVVMPRESYLAYLDFLAKKREPKPIRKITPADWTGIAGWMSNP